jgi:DMSO/TMAO reductase YedYZ molybdopterin-dependent catalytic subunit
MEERRKFLKAALGLFAGTAMLFSPVFQIVRQVYAKAKRIILPKGTRRESLINRDPSELDTINLEATPLKDFNTMGETGYEIKVEDWRLEVYGNEGEPLKLTYSSILEMPSIEKNVLLICPGFFANHGRWKGISMDKFLNSIKIPKEVRRVSFIGKNSYGEKAETFPIGEILANEVFLAYGVNGETLPRKHGFPLRIVAGDYYGGDWVKYVYKMEFKK